MHRFYVTHVVLRRPAVLWQLSALKEKAGMPCTLQCSSSCDWCTSSRSRFVQASRLLYRRRASCHTSHVVRLDATCDNTPYLPRRAIIAFERYVCRTGGARHAACASGTCYTWHAFTQRLITCPVLPDVPSSLRAGRTGRLAAAVAAADSATAAPATTEGTDSAGSSLAAAAPARDPLEASVGTIVTIITPGERFVVDKLAGQLAVPLQVSGGVGFLAEQPANREWVPACVGGGGVHGGGVVRNKGRRFRKIAACDKLCGEVPGVGHAGPWVGAQGGDVGVGSRRLTSQLQRTVHVNTASTSGCRLNACAACASLAGGPHLPRRAARGPPARRVLLREGRRERR